jgi:hypothetical protein
MPGPTPSTAAIEADPAWVPKGCHGTRHRSATYGAPTVEDQVVVLPLSKLSWKT